MPGLGGGWAAGVLVREGKGVSARGRGRGTLCLSPSQMAATHPPMLGRTSPGLDARGGVQHLVFPH